ncbi:MAG: hypothetical protein HXY41_04770 [Chloroflexi bacterium]|jgi:hypothetical protein|nr:hypothetical protein [Chloroflexota bacterium]
MANWLKVTRPNVESTSGFMFYQSAVINLDAATSFGMQSAGSVAVFIDGKAYIIQQQFDAKAYETALKYIEARTQGVKLP